MLSEFNVVVFCMNWIHSLFCCNITTMITGCSNYSGNQLLDPVIRITGSRIWEYRAVNMGTGPSNPNYWCIKNDYCDK